MQTFVTKPAQGPNACFCFPFCVFVSFSKQGRSSEPKASPGPESPNQSILTSQNAGVSLPTLERTHPVVTIRMCSFRNFKGTPILKTQVSSVCVATAWPQGPLLIHLAWRSSVGARRTRPSPRIDAMGPVRLGFQGLGFSAGFAAMV